MLRNWLRITHLKQKGNSTDMIEGDARRGYYVVDKKPGKQPRIVGGPYSKIAAEQAQRSHYRLALKEDDKQGKGRCPDCGGVMEFNGRCGVCRGCGYARC